MRRRKPACVFAVVVSLWDGASRLPLAGLYALGLAAVGMGEIWRGFSPGKFFVWGCTCDLAGFVLVTALLGWLLPHIKSASTMLRIPNESTRWSVKWFLPSQALLAAVAAALAAWVSMDFSFDGLGEGVALFGLSGRLAGCPAALMLLGAAILMAWQAHGAWRAAWQWAAMAAGMLFTSSLGWAQLDAAVAFSVGDTPWLHRSANLLLSASMMTLMTRFGLALVLPGQSDWILRARQASPVFGGLALLMLTAVLIQKALLLASLFISPRFLI